MKKLLIVLVFSLSGMIAKAQDTTAPEIAKVDQLKGFYLFVDAQPAAPFQYLGSVKYSGSFGSGQFIDVRDELIKRARKAYPLADGLIFHFVTGKADEAEVIQFKK